MPRMIVRSETVSGTIFSFSSPIENGFPIKTLAVRHTRRILELARSIRSTELSSVAIWCSSSMSKYSGPNSCRLPQVLRTAYGSAARHQGNAFLFSDRCQLREFYPLNKSFSPLNKEMYQIINALELSKRWNLPVTWIREHCRPRTSDPIPHIKFGHYTRFEWDSPDLTEWLERHKNNGKGR